jgi:hypothetical protein
MNEKNQFLPSISLFAAAFLAATPHSSKAADSGMLEIPAHADMRITKVDPLNSKLIERISNSLVGSHTIMGVFKDRDRSLVLFDISSIPKGTKIKKATLELTVVLDGFNPSRLPMGIYRITEAWDELGASWFEASSGTFWSEPGGAALGVNGQLLDAPYATNTDTGEPINDIPAKLNWDVTSLITEWVSGKFPNHGLMVKTESGDNRAFCKTR